jgi:hypothetical protein
LPGPGETAVPVSSAYQNNHTKNASVHGSGYPDLKWTPRSLAAMRMIAPHDNRGIPAPNAKSIERGDHPGSGDHGRVPLIEYIGTRSVCLSSSIYLRVYSEGPRCLPRRLRPEGPGRKFAIVLFTPGEILAGSCRSGTRSYCIRARYQGFHTAIELATLAHSTALRQHNALPQPCGICRRRNGT